MPKLAGRGEISKIVLPSLCGKGIPGCVKVMVSVYTPFPFSRGVIMI